MKKVIRWNVEKAKQLLDDPSRGGIIFEDCVVAIESGGGDFGHHQEPELQSPQPENLRFEY